MTGVTALLAGVAGERLAVSANNVSGGGSGDAFSGAVTTNTPSTTVTGGVAPIAYSWAYVSGSTVPIINGPANAQNPTWGNSDTPDGLNAATWRVTVTDGSGTSVSRDITVSLVWTSNL